MITYRDKRQATAVARALRAANIAAHSVGRQVVYGHSAAAGAVLLKAAIVGK